MSAVLLSGQHIGELCTISHQVTQMEDIGRRDKAGLDHTAHVQITNPFRVLAVGLVAFLRFRVLGMR